MTVRDRVFGAFKESFDLDDDIDTSKLVYQEYPSWTSIGHMILVAALESEFDTMLETDDILEMSNFDKAVSIMSKYANEALRQAMTVGETEQASTLEAADASLGVGLVSVIVPHLNDYDNLDTCLRLLQGQSFPSDRTEVIVADNGSSGGLDAVRRLVGSRGRVVEVVERGAGPARNAGVRASRGDALAFIDSDCRPDKGWLEEGLSELRSADFVGGRVDVLVEDPQRMTGAEAFESVFAFQNERYVKDLKFTVTASMFVWRSVFDAVGGFENGVPEDKDW